MKPVAANSPKLLDKLRLRLRTSHYSYRTEQAYVRWVEKFLRYNRGRNGGCGGIRQRWERQKSRNI